MSFRIERPRHGSRGFQLVTKLRLVTLVGKLCFPSCNEPMSAAAPPSTCERRPALPFDPTRSETSGGAFPSGAREREWYNPSTLPPLRPLWPFRLRRPRAPRFRSGRGVDDEVSPSPVHTRRPQWLPIVADRQVNALARSDEPWLWNRRCVPITDRKNRTTIPAAIYKCRLDCLTMWPV